MSIKVREALSDDSITLSTLYSELTEDPNIQVLPSRITEILNNNENFLFVITVEDLVKGSCLVTLCLDPMYGNQPYAVLENIVVDSQHQGDGLGSEMLKQIEQFCSAKDVSKIMLMSSASRIKAHAFFKSLNYQDTGKKGFVKYRSSFID